MKISPGTKAMVTGAASGIGRCIALALAREGAALCLVDIDEANLAIVAREARGLGVEAIVKVADLSQPPHVRDAAAFVRSEWDRLNILVNCAGVCHYGRTDGMSAAQWEQTLAVNLLAPIALVQELLPTLVMQEQAHIVNVCSIHGLVPTLRAAAYQTSKFGLVGLSAALHAEYARAGFGVTALCPGIVRTPMIDKLEPALSAYDDAVPSWIGTSPEVVAAHALKAIRNNKALVVVPASARVLWWLARLSPGLVAWLTRKRFI